MKHGPYFLGKCLVRARDCSFLEQGQVYLERISRPKGLVVSGYSYPADWILLVVQESCSAVFLYRSTGLEAFEAAGRSSYGGMFSTVLSGHLHILHAEWKQHMKSLKARAHPFGARRDIPIKKSSWQGQKGGKHPVPAEMLLKCLGHWETSI